jgi:hypothetical protein
MPTERTYVVDRIEGDLVVLVEDESGEMVNVDSWELPLVNEGTVLRVSVRDNQPQWSTAEIDDHEATRRKAESRQILADLKKRDPGGDVEL